ncbi:hypothetical protein COCOBI_09-2020 [Coccomyxa sp. Obi]|nr:hypothetical protein COCOBI_09-2020 [Coccomyxa sp. Obi]
MRKQPESDNHKAPAEAVSKAEEALDNLVSRHTGTTKVRHRDKALRALDYVGSPSVLFGSALLFLLIAWDIFGGTSKFPVQSFYILPHHIDWPVHAWVKGTFPPMLRDMAAEKLMSNLPIYLGSLGWLACAFAAVVQNPARGSRGVGITVFAMWIVSGVGSGRSDVLIVDILKHYFQRVRPSDIHQSYAFPSGHTTFSVFVLGALLYVIVPLCVAGPEGDTEGGDLTAKESRILDVLVSAVQASALPLWILGGAITASGRILADVHWVSDTMGGACLGVFMVSVAANICKALRV